VIAPVRAAIKGAGAMLDAGQIDRYRRDGYLFPLPALSADEIAQCLAEQVQRHEREFTATPAS